MRSIVVYRMIIASGILVLATTLAAQKPAIDLISSHQQYRHPEAIIDTGYAEIAPFKDGFLTPSPSAQNSTLSGETEKKKRRQIGPSIDSLFQKEEKGDIEQENAPVKVSLFYRQFNPIKFLLYITALK